MDNKLKRRIHICDNRFFDIENIVVKDKTLRFIENSIWSEKLSPVIDVINNIYYKLNKVYKTGRF